MTPLPSHSGATPPNTPGRRSGREAPQVLTAAFRRYVDRVQAVEEPAPHTDLHAALRLAEEIGEHATADRSVVAAHGPAIRQLARGVRQAGRGAVAHPALLARAIVLARLLGDSDAADARGEARRRRAPAAAR
jgi:hypothetical protein